ncbi:MAG: alcohol dehydrogenase catalytic domain-containing protein [Hymenobacter sp.]
MPGHEVIGRVDEIGPNVTKFKVGDMVGVGCMVDSCGVCPSCQEREENYCEGPVSWMATYNGYSWPAPWAQRSRPSPATRKSAKPPSSWVRTR